jgi:PTH1 family peptidyl-tRNA hydrolase
MAKLIVGLGNPGEKYKMTRHNLGFRVIDKISENLNLPEAKQEAKFKADISEYRINNEKILFAKPQTFMNKSGQAVNQISCFYKIKPENIWIIYDDMDLSLGKLKISFNKNSGGHKGVQSIIDRIGRKDFFRFRIGTKANLRLKTQKFPPTADPLKAEKLQFKTQNYEQAKCKLENFVLGKFSDEEEKIIQKAIKKTALAIEAALKENIEKAISKLN